MRLKSVLDSHIHFTLPSDSASDKVKFKLDVIAAAIETAYAIPTGSPFTSELVLVGDEAGKNNLLGLADIPAINSTVSTVYQCRLTRVAASSDDYAFETYIDFNDSHYKKDTVGSLTEDTKV